MEEQEIILKNENCMFLQVPQEVLIGSGLIVPIVHRENLFDLTEDEWNSTFSLLQEVKTLLDERYNPDGYNVGWNSQPAGGQHIMHAHLHVIPRFKDEPFAGKGIRYWIKDTKNKRV
ncbi:HIT family protein [Psychrobacillus sp. OK032]|uniref:HIT family protein n=1 Tax=Psychrobacillus sp. OK032 TaxID=1884358 RepID=UPI00350E9ABD